MNCGDAGHILLSARAADDLAQHAEWKAQLHEIGEAEVKHGIKIGVVNFSMAMSGIQPCPKNSAVATSASRGGSSPDDRMVVRRNRCGGCDWSCVLDSVLAAPSFATASTGELQKSIAVLPLENLSEDKADAFFADGIQDDVLTSLSKIS